MKTIRTRPADVSGLVFCLVYVLMKDPTFPLAGDKPETPHFGAYDVYKLPLLS